MPIVLVTYRIQQAGLDVLTERSDIVIARCLDPASEEKLIHRVVNADAILVGTTAITSRIIEAARVLKVVSRRGVGHDNIDLAVSLWFRICRYLFELVKKLLVGRGGPFFGKQVKGLA